MSIRIPLIVSLVLIAIMTALSVWAWPLVPASARVAIHFDASGAPNGFVGKQLGLFMGPVSMFVMTALLCVIPIIEPRSFNLAASAKFYKACWIGVILILAYAHASIVLTATQVPVDIPHTTLAGVAFLYIVIGNYMGKTRSNFFAGVRTPWTLSSDYSWEKTNRLTGRLFILTGATTLVACFTISTIVTVAILVVGAVTSSIIGIVASYVYWRRDPNRYAQDHVPE
jgi:uncharacterized membrane protein